MIVIRSILVFLFVSFSQIYDGDNRIDVIDLSESDQRFVQASVTLVDSRTIIETGSDTFRLNTNTLEREQGFCPDERFAQHPVVLGSFCSGGLVAPDLILTSAHCAPSMRECRRTSIVFGINSETISSTFNESSRYSCIDIIPHDYGPEVDVALIRLNRPVEGVEPLTWRRSGQIAVGDEVFTIGSPRGLTMLHSAGNVSYVGEQGEGVGTTIDAFTGNSGGLVISREHGVVEGVMTSAQPRRIVYDVTGCLRWADAEDVDSDTFEAYPDRQWAAGTAYVPISYFESEMSRYAGSPQRRSPSFLDRILNRTVE